MVVDVVDIRKRIQKVRNDVSDSVLSRRLPEAASEQVNQDVSLEFVPAEHEDTAQASQFSQASLPLEETVSAQQIPASTKIAHRAVTDAMAMPSFNLNITNRHSSRLLMALIALQLFTNLVLVIVLILK